MTGFDFDKTRPNAFYGIKIFVFSKGPINDNQAMD